MATFAQVVASVASRASGFLRGWTFRLPFAQPPTDAELTVAIDEMIEQMQGPDYPKLSVWIAEHLPEINIQIIGVYRDS